MLGIDGGDILQFIGTSVTVALTFHLFVEAMWQLILNGVRARGKPQRDVERFTLARRDIERLHYHTPILMILYLHYYAGLLALPWFVLSVFTCLASPVHSILDPITIFLLIVGWLVLLVTIFNVTLSSAIGVVNDWVEQHPKSKSAKFIKKLKSDC